MVDLSSSPCRYLLDYQENGFSTGTLRLDRSRFLSRLDAKPSVVSILPAFAKDRQEVEQFIIDIYAKSYGALIGIHYPTLMSVRDEQGGIMAALGFRYASEDTLFLEQYLRQPVETVLSSPRGQIVEIGNLASAGGGASVFLFAALSAYLDGRNQKHAVVTSTAFLSQRFRDMGLRPKILAKANPDLLLHKDEHWGSYYDTRPQVLAGRIDHGFRKLTRVLGAHYTQNAPRLLPRLHYKESAL